MNTHTYSNQLLLYLIDRLRSIQLRITILLHCRDNSAIILYNQINYLCKWKIKLFIKISEGVN